MGKDRKEGPLGGVRLRYQATERILLRTLNEVERRLAGLEVEAIRLKLLGRELAQRARADELHDEWPAVEEFFAFNRIVCDECQRVQRRLEADAQDAGVKVVVIRVPVIVRPEPSTN
ncbi:MAG TPA: hypothetical protein VH592_03220 [Gemmataceae bacterium]|jgi:hypothetical protein